MNKFKIILLIFTMILTSNQSFAQSKIYESDVCDFTAEFPDNITITKKCIPSTDSNSPEICGETLSYTRAFNTGTSLEINLSCNKINKETYDRFSKDEIMFTFESLIKGNKDISSYGMSYTPHMKSKRAYSLASGKAGLSPMINILYLWVGENSFMSVDAKLIGKENKTADELFTKITASIKNKVLDVPAIQEETITKED